VVTLLTRDHQAVEDRFADFDADGEDLEELFWKLTDQLVRHEVAEEVVVYPVLRRAPGGEAMAEARLAEQSEAEQQLARMAKLDTDSDEFLTELETLETAVTEHARHEEGEAFPLLTRTEPADRLVELGRRYEAAKTAVPSEPPLKAVDAAPADRVAALADRVRAAARLV